VYFNPSRQAVSFTQPSEPNAAVILWQLKSQEISTSSIGRPAKTSCKDSTAISLPAIT
jgi:hypothetical protein